MAAIGSTEEHSANIHDEEVALMGPPAAEPPRKRGVIVAVSVAAALVLAAVAVHLGKGAPEPQAAGEVLSLGATSAVSVGKAQTGCRNWKKDTLKKYVGKTFGECSALCTGWDQCVSFNFQAKECASGKGDEPHTCILYNEACDEMPNDCWFLHPRAEFQKTQFLGFGINTFPEAMADEDKYIGDVDDKKDVLERFELMKQVVEKTATEANLDASPSTLKVFIAPEFYFRGGMGAYNVTDLFDCLQDGIDKCNNAAVLILLNEMKTFAADERWSDWLFVFGTILAAWPETIPGPQGRMPKVEVVNIAPIIRGGPQGQGFLVPKVSISHIDFLKCIRLGQGVCGANDGGEYYTKITDSVKDLMKPTWEFTDNDMFSIGGVLFGLEVCLDHSNAVLYHAMKNDSVVPGGGVQVQLITSAGMALTYNAVPDGAPEYLQDGAPDEMHSQSAGQEYRLQPQIDIWGTDWATVIGPYFSTKHGGLLQSNWAPKVRVFAPVAIPPSIRFTPP